jgi:hydroxymethylglutaryl-CoA lyase
MAGTAEVLRGIRPRPGVRYPVLVPNAKGLSNLFDLLSSTPPDQPPITDEVAIFAAASESFSKANTHCSIAESLERLAPVAELALARGLRVRGYVSTVIACSYEGPIAPKSVRDVAKALIDMGCYEVSLGDTTGFGNPTTMTNMLDSVISQVSVDKLAVSTSDV